MILYPYTTDNTTNGKFIPCAITQDGGLVPREHTKLVFLPYKIEEERAA
jgi:hypothetical protein